MPERVGQYELLNRFAEGGMAEVFFGRFTGLQGFKRECAIKRLLPEFTRRPEIVDMFLTEAKLAASMLHPGIVQVFDLGEHDGTYFMAMELVDGPHLGKLIAHSVRVNQPIPDELCAWIVMQAAEALHHAHGRRDPVTGELLGIIHRDMSPQNILVSRWGDVKVTDFGIAKVKRDGNKTDAGVLKGKLGYLSPEQIHGTPMDHRVDVFALGIVLYECLTRRRLYGKGSDLQVMQAITGAPTPSARTLRPEIDSDLDQIVLRALEKEADDRFRTAQELADSLSAWLNRRPVTDLRGSLSYWLHQYGHDIWPTLRKTMSYHASSKPATRPLRARPSLTRGEPSAGRPKTSFIGRRKLLRTLSKRIARGDRWTALTGPAGVGKSRIGWEWLTRNGNKWRKQGGAWRVDLNETSDQLDLRALLASTLSISLPNRPAAEVDSFLLDALVARGPLLIFVDHMGEFPSTAHNNVELLKAWLDGAPELQIVTMSRERFGVAAEDLLEVTPLELPGAAPLAASEAALLLAARAAAARPGFRLSETSDDVVRQLLEALDGLPAAIEFVASAIAQTDPVELLRRVQGGDRLTDNATNGLNSALIQTWSTLHKDHQRNLHLLCVFDGGFDESGATAVLGPVAPQVLRLLRSKSLIQVQEHGGLADTRYQLLNTTRNFVTTQRTEAELRQAQRLHARHYIRRAGQWLRDIHQHGGPVAAQRLRRERANMFAALQWTAESKEEANVTTLLDALIEAMPPARERLDQLLRMAESAGMDTAELRLRQAQLHIGRGELDAADRRLTEARALSQDDRHLKAEIGVLASELASRQRRHDEAMRHSRAALDVAERSEDRSQLGRALAVMGNAHWEAGELEEACEHLGRAADILRMAGDLPRESDARLLWARALLDRGELREARSVIDGALLATTQCGDRARMNRFQYLQGRLEMEVEEDITATASLHLARQAAKESGDVGLLAAVKLYDSLRLLMSGRTGQALSQLEATEPTLQRGLFHKAVLQTHAFAAAGDIAAANQAYDVAAALIAEVRTETLDAELAVAQASVEAAQAGSGGSPLLFQRALHRVTDVQRAHPDGPQSLRLTVAMWRASWGARGRRKSEA